MTRTNKAIQTSQRVRVSQNDLGIRVDEAVKNSYRTPHNRTATRCSLKSSYEQSCFRGKDFNAVDILHEMGYE